MESLIKCLNEYLSDLEVLAIKFQNYHWNVKGKDFFIMHEKLEEYYECIKKEIDEIAESILMIGGEPLGTLSDFIKNANIEEASNEKICSDKIYQELNTDLNKILSKTIQIKEEADKNNMYLISILMDEQIKNYSKKIWMITQINL